MYGSNIVSYYSHIVQKSKDEGPTRIVIYARNCYRKTRVPTSSAPRIKVFLEVYLKTHPAYTFACKTGFILEIFFLPVTRAPNLAS